VNVQIGIAEAKELEVQVDDPDALVAAYEAAVEAGEVMMAIEESDGARAVVAVGAIVYFRMESISRPGIGFVAEA